MNSGKFAVSTFVAATLFLASATGQSTMKPETKSEKNMFLKDFSKGGVGIISEELYVVVKSSKNNKNELIVQMGHLGKDQRAPVPEKRWTGKTAGESEIAVYF